MKTQLILTISTTLLIACISCNSSNEADRSKVDPAIVNNPASADPAASSETKAVPMIEFEKTRHHFGVIVAGEKVSYTFKFKNTGDAPLVLSSASATCGCTVPSYTKEAIQPGDEGSVEVTFDSSGKSGMESKNITIGSNTIPNSTVLTISAEINSSENNN